MDRTTLRRRARWGLLFAMVLLLASSQAGTAAATTALAPPTGGLPGKVAGISAEAQGHVGPFIDGKGNLYTVSEITAADARMKMMKSADGGRTWTEMDGANRPVRYDLEAVWMVQEGTTLYIVHQRSGGGVHHHVFDTSDAATAPDRWRLKDETVASPSAPRDQYVSLVRLGNGDLWAFYGLNSGGNRIGYRKKPVGGAWGAQVLLDTVSTGQAVAVRGAGDTTHIFYNDETNRQIKHKTLTASGVLSAAQRVDDNGVNAVHSPMTNAVFFDDGGVETLVVAWANAAGALRSAQVRGGVATEEVALSTASVVLDPDSTTNRAAVAHLALDGQTVHALWSDGATADVFHDVSSGAGWGTDVEIKDGVSAHWLYGTVFTHNTANGGQRVLGYLYDNNVDNNPDTDGIEYDELRLGGG